MANPLFPAANSSGRSEKSVKQQLSELPAGIMATEMEAQTKRSELEVQAKRSELVA